MPKFFDRVDVKYINYYLYLFPEVIHTCHLPNDTEIILMLT